MTFSAVIQPITMLAIQYAAQGRVVFFQTYFPSGKLKKSPPYPWRKVIQLLQGGRGFYRRILFYYQRYCFVH